MVSFEPDEGEAMVVCSFRADRELIDAVDEVARKLRRNRSDTLRLMLEWSSENMPAQSPWKEAT